MSLASFWDDVGMILVSFWNDFDTLLLDTAKMNDLLLNFKVGSVQNKGKYPPSKEEWFRIIKTIQEYVLSNSEHKIPILFFYFDRDHKRVLTDSFLLI